MAFEAAKTELDTIVYRTYEELTRHRQGGGSDDEYVERLINQFVTEARNHPAGAGSVHMALSLYQLVTQHEQISSLTESLAMRDAVLNTMTEIEKL